MGVWEKNLIFRGRGNRRGEMFRFFTVSFLLLLWFLLHRMLNVCRVMLLGY